LSLSTPLSYAIKTQKKPFFKSKYLNLNMKNKRLLIILAIAATMLLTPLIAMQFTSEVDWTRSDFVIMGIMLFGTGMLCELILRKVKSFKNRIAICGVVLFAFFLIWGELAVGIFGTPFAGS
jgi:hypothetical protein